MDSFFSSTLDTVAPLRLRKIKEKSPVLRRLRKSPVAQHFAESRHSVSTLQYIGIEVVKCPRHGGDINILLLENREAFWIFTLDMLTPR